MAAVALAVFLPILWILVSAGERLLRLAGLDTDRGPERLGLSLATSLAALTALVFALALARLVSAATMLGLLVLGASLSVPELRANLRRTLAVLRRSPAVSLDGLFAAATAAIALLGAFVALSPPTTMDALGMHFTAPKRMLQEGGLPLSSEVYFHRSGGFYFVYLLGFALQGELLARLLNFAAFLGVLALSGSAAERLRPGAGVLGAFVAATAPVAGGYAGYEYLEMPALLFVLAGVVCLQRQAFTAALLFAGLSVAMKNSAFGAVVLAAWSAWRAWRARAYRPLAAGMILSALAVLAWPLWNKASTGSFFPWYPVGEERPGLGGSASLALQALRLLGSVFLGSLYWTDFAGPFVVAGLAGALIFRPAAPGGRWLAGLAAAAVIVYAAGVLTLAKGVLGHHCHARYLGPCVVGFGAPLAAAFAHWALGGPSLLRVPVLFALLVPAGPLLVLKAGKAAVVAPVVFGLESRPSYLAKKVETFRACEAVNALPARGVVVFFVGIRSYPLERPFVMPFDVRLRAGSASAESLRRLGVTHVIHEPGAYAEWDVVFDGPGFRKTGEWPIWGGRAVRLFEVTGVP